MDTIVDTFTAISDGVNNGNYYLKVDKTAVTAADSNVSQYCHFLSWEIIDDQSKFNGKVTFDEPEAPTQLIIENLARSVEPGEYKMRIQVTHKAKESHGQPGANIVQTAAFKIVVISSCADVATLTI